MLVEVRMDRLIPHINNIVEVSLKCHSHASFRDCLRTCSLCISMKLSLWTLRNLWANAEINGKALIENRIKLIHL